MKGLSIQNVGFIGSLTSVLTPTFEDDFSSYANTTEGDAAWPTSDTTNARVNPTTDVIDYSGKRDNTNDSISKPLGVTVSDTAWVARFRLNFSALTAGAAAQLCVCLSDLPYTTDSVTAQDTLGFVFDWNNTGEFGTGSADGGIILIDAATENSSVNFTTATDYYIEMIRLTSTTFQIKIFSDSAYTTQTGTTVSTTIAATTVSLDNFKINNRKLASCCSGSLTCVIDDIKVWDGVTSV